MTTERTTSAINALLADNSIGAISPQDLRDAIATAMGGYASLVLTANNAPATLSSVGTSYSVITQYDIVGAQSSDNNTSGSSASAASGLITIGTTGVYLVTFSTSFSTSANNKLVTFRPHIDGSPGIVEVDRAIGTGSDIGSASITGVVTYTAGQSVDMRVKIDAGTSNVIFQALAFAVVRVG